MGVRTQLSVGAIGQELGSENHQALAANVGQLGGVNGLGALCESKDDDNDEVCVSTHVSHAAVHDQQYLASSPHQHDAWAPHAL